MRKSLTSILVLCLIVSGLSLGTNASVFQKNPPNNQPTDVDYFYYGGQNTETVIQCWASNLTERTEYDYGDFVTSIISDGQYLYIAGHENRGTIVQVWPDNLTMRQESSYYGHINAIACDGTFIYATGIQSGSHKVYQYWASNLTKKQESLGLPGAATWAITCQDSYVYVVGGIDYQLGYIYQLWTSNMTIRAHSQVSSGFYFSVQTIGDYVFVGTSVTVDGGVIKKLKASDLTEVTSVNYGGSVFALTYDGHCLYAGGHNRQTVCKYWPTDLTLVAESEPYNNYIVEIKCSNPYIYIGGYGNKVWELWSSNLTKRGETVNYGGHIEALYADYTYTNQPPLPPTGPSPTNQATDVDRDAKLTWTCTDPDLDPLTYDVYFGTTSPPPLVASAITHSTYDPQLLTYGTTYYWQIIAHDSTETTTGEIWTFTTTINDPPLPPSNPTPANNTINVNRDITLTWTCSDPHDDPLTYDVYFGTTSPPPLVSKAQTKTSYKVPTTLDWGTKCYWQIIANDSANTTAGPNWTFTTIADTTPPTITIVRPQQGYLYLRDIEYMKRQTVNLTLAIGVLTVNLEASDSQSGLRNIQIFINDRLQENLTSPPYTWIWIKPSLTFGIKTLKAVAFDNKNNMQITQIKLRKIL
jgi:hypothetical protein